MCLGDTPPLGTLGDVSENLFLGSTQGCPRIWVDDKFIVKCLVHSALGRSRVTRYIIIRCPNKGEDPRVPLVYTLTVTAKKNNEKKVRNKKSTPPPLLISPGSLSMKNVHIKDHFFVLVPGWSIFEGWNFAYPFLKETFLKFLPFLILFHIPQLTKF